MVQNLWLYPTEIGGCGKVGVMKVFWIGKVEWRDGFVSGRLHNCIHNVADVPFFHCCIYALPETKFMLLGYPQAPDA